MTDRMSAYPDPDYSLWLLKNAGWTVSGCRLHTLDWRGREGRLYLVTAFICRGEDLIEACAPTAAQALWECCLQARAVGLLGGQRQLLQGDGR